MPDTIPAPEPADDDPYSVGKVLWTYIPDMQPDTPKRYIPARGLIVGVIGLAMYFPPVKLLIRMADGSIVVRDKMTSAPDLADIPTQIIELRPIPHGHHLHS